MGQFPSSFKLSWKQIVVSFLVAVYIAVNLFRIGGDAFVINLNNNIVNPLALGVTVLAVMISLQIGGRGQNRLLWWGLTIGWTLWTIAQFWWGIASIIGQEVPYPSWADFFWLVGYVPMYFALWERIRSLPLQTNPMQKAGIWFSILLCGGWTIAFVIIPILQYNDPSAMLESILNILYPLADLILLIMVLRIFFTYQQGSSGRAWGWISAGFILTSLSDLIFSYATTAELYYPDGQANLLSTIGVDVPYNLGYLFWVIGLLIIRTIQTGHYTFADTHMPIPLVPNTHLLVFTKGDNTVIDVSQNYSRIYPLEIVQGKTLLEVLGISPTDTDSLLLDIKASKILKERPILVKTRFGPQQAFVCGESVTGPQGAYSGVALLLRMTTADDSLDELLTNYHKGMVRLLVSKTGTKEKEEEEIKQLLTNYRLAYFKAYYNRVFSEGGSILADAFINDLQSVAGLHKWQIGIRADALLDTSAMSLSTTREALPLLSESAKQYVIKITDEAAANMIVQNVLSHFDESTLKNVSRFENAREENL